MSLRADPTQPPWYRHKLVKGVGYAVGGYAAFSLVLAFLALTLGSKMWGVVAVGFVGVAYFFPSIVAGRRGHHNTTSVFVVNLFLGWTLIGWVVALAMAASAIRRDVY
jgi:hypothetical protein